MPRDISPAHMDKVVAPYAFPLTPAPPRRTIAGGRTVRSRRHETPHGMAPLCYAALAVRPYVVANASKAVKNPLLIQHPGCARMEMAAPATAHRPGLLPRTAGS